MRRYESYYLLPGLVWAFIFATWGVATLLTILLWIAGVEDAATISVGVAAILVPGVMLLTYAMEKQRAKQAPTCPKCRSSISKSARFRMRIQGRIDRVGARDVFTVCPSC